MHALLPLAHRVDRGPAIRLEMPPGRAPRPHTEPAPAVLGRDPGVLGRLALPADAVAAGARADHAHPLLGLAGDPHADVPGLAGHPDARVPVLVGPVGNPDDGNPSPVTSTSIGRSVTAASSLSPDHVPGAAPAGREDGGGDRAQDASRSQWLTGATRALGARFDGFRRIQEGR